MISLHVLTADIEWIIIDIMSLCTPDDFRYYNTIKQYLNDLCLTI